MKKVLLGMSGGVDSSVAALLLQKNGYEVIGGTMQLWHNDNGCGSMQASIDAKIICDKLGIEHHTFNFEKEFKQYVVDNFINSYLNGITPNPCIECNRFLKFNLLYEEAKKIGCEYIATGHYAKTEFSDKYNKIVIKKSDSINKDQSYVLYTIDKSIVDKVIFPLSNFEEKEEIRKIAEDNELFVAHKPDSQDICFIPDNDYKKFILENIDIKQEEGNIVDTKGNILGRHKGLINYTVGQRKGMGIAYKEPLHVLKLDMERNELIVGIQEDTYKNELQATNLNMLIDSIIPNMKIQAKIRYSAKCVNAVLNVENEIATVVFDTPQKYITPGQSVVFYDEDIVIGGGIII